MSIREARAELLARTIRDGSLNWQTGLETIANGRDSLPVDARHLNETVLSLTNSGLLVKVGNRVWEATEKGHAADTRQSAVVQVSAPDPLARVGPRPKADRTRELAARLATAQATIAAAGEIPDVEASESLRLVACQSDDWRVAVPAMFPRMCKVAFAPHHADLWDWVWALEPGVRPDPKVVIWSRGHSKSGIAEMACAMVGHRRVRKYVLYVSGKQAKADDHVQNIGNMLESDEISKIDLELSSRNVNKYGSSKGWRHNRLTTEAGFKIDAVGLDSDIRGARLDEDRPDLVIFDDVDGLTDSPATIEQKIQRISRDLIPTGAPDVAYLFVQNIIHSQSVAARLAKQPGAPRIDMLALRTISGPIPAVHGLRTKEVHDEERDIIRNVIVEGEASWPEGWPLEACQSMIDDEGLTAFLAECQHEEGTLLGGMFDDIDFTLRRKGIADLPALRENGTWIGPCGTWIDPAVTSNDKSDSCSVVTGGLAQDRKMWFVDSWERVSTPEEATLRGLESAMRWGSQVLGFEVDQGGDTWEVVYRSVVRSQLDDPGSYTYQRHKDHGVSIPKYAERRATSDGQMSKRQRIAQMMARYQTDQFRHFDEGTVALEAGLKRFPKYKPFDVCDGAYHCYRWLAENGGENTARRMTTKRAQGSLPEVRPHVI